MSRVRFPMVSLIIDIILPTADRYAYQGISCGGEDGRCVGLTTLPIVLKYGSLSSLGSEGPVQACTGIALPLQMPRLKLEFHNGTVSDRINITYLLTYLLTYLFTPWSRVLLEKLTGFARNSPHFMEPESSLPYSKMPATCPYPESTPSSLHPLPLPEDPF